MPPKEPPRRRVPGPARPRSAAGGQGRPRPAARRSSPASRPRAPRNRSASPLRLGSPRPRLRLVSLALTLVMLTFVVRLLQVQAVDASAYAAKAKENRYLSYTISAERGEITDRSGIALATSVDAYNITADPSMFTPGFSKAPDAPQQAAALLAPILGTDATELTRKLSGKGRYAVLARRQTPQVWNQIKDLKSVFAEKAGKDRANGGPGANVLAGVFQEATTRRVYPNGVSPPGYWVTSMPRARARAASNRSWTGSSRARTARSGTPRQAAAGCPPRAPRRSRPYPAPTSS